MKDLHGIHIPGHKNTSAMKAAKLPLPQSVVIPMAMHIGAPAQPVVAPGERVAAGQLIATCPQGKLGANIHASISGQVESVDGSIVIAG